jgi:RimJ/RimL family protein N-acetyltransferase/GNAT superfamily N-acetyltransferase
MDPSYRTRRLCIRGWTPADAPALKEAVDASRDQLRPWLPWADEPPSPVGPIADQLAAFARDFAAGAWWGYGLFPRDGDGCAPRVLGGLGVHRARHPDQPPSTREIGYWLRTDATGCGYMTEAAGALADAALAEPGVLAVEIRVDPENAASARVPERLGFALRERRVGDRLGADGRPRDTLVWERRGDAPLRAATPADLPRLAEIRGAVRENQLDTPGLVTEADYLATIARGTCWVWEDGDGVQGFASGAPGDDALVWALFVHPTAERRGAGSALLARLTDELWRRGYRQLTLDTRSGTRAEQLYRAAGWTEVGRTPRGDVLFRRDL